MSPSGLLAFDPHTGALAMGHEFDLLVHGAPNEVPLWRRTLDAPVVGVGATAAGVVSLEANGNLTWWGARGEPSARRPLGDAPLALAVAPGGACAVLLRGRVALVRPGADVQTFDAPEGTALAFSTDGARLALGTASGRVVAFDATGRPSGEVALEHAARSLAASPRGDFYATAGERIVRVDFGANRAENVTRAGGFAPDCLALSADGALFAARLDDSLVLCLGLPPGETVAQLRYVECRATGLAFGPGRVLGVSLSNGEANYVDIPKRQLRRTDDFPGRPHQSWLVKVSIDPAAAPPPAGAAPAPPPHGHGLAATPPGLDATAPAPLRPAAAFAGPAAAARGATARWTTWGLLAVCLAVLGLATWWKVERQAERAREDDRREMREQIRRDVSKSVHDAVERSKKK
jgi:hypothetical protein